MFEGKGVEHFEGIVEEVCWVQRLLHVRHVVFITYVVLDVGLAALHPLWSVTFPCEVSRFVAVVAFLYFGAFFQLGDIPSCRAVTP